MRFSTLIGGCLSLALFCLSSIAKAEALHPKMDAKHSFRIGSYFQTVDFDISVTRPPDSKNTLDLADDLGVDENKTSVLLDYRWRFLERWHLTFGYHEFDSDGLVGNSIEFNFDGTVFPVGYDLKTDVGFDAYILDINYALSRSDRHEFSIGAGLHVFDLKFDLAGRLFIGDFEVARENEASELFAPLPNLRFYGFYAISSKWHVAATAGWLSLEYDSWDGDYSYLNVRAEYQFSERFGVGLGYQFTNIDLKQDTTSKVSEYNIDVAGPTLYFSFAI